MATAANKPSRERTQAYRERLRAQGLKPVTIWVPDVSKPEVRAQIARDCRLLDKSADEEEVLALAGSLVNDLLSELDELEKE